MVLVLGTFERFTAVCERVCFRGVQLIERNEEVCVFYERVNLQGRSSLFTARSHCTVPV